MTRGTQVVAIDFTNGVATPNLTLNHAETQNISFCIEGLVTKDTAPISITPTVINQVALRLAGDITAPLSNGGVFGTQPVVAIVDEFGNTCTSDNSTIVTVSKQDVGTWTLTGSTTKTAVNGMVTFTDIGATNSSKVTNAQLAFNATGLVEITSAAVTLPAPSTNNDSSSSNEPNPVFATSSQGGETNISLTTTVGDSNNNTGIASADINGSSMTLLANKAKNSEANGEEALVEIKVEAPADTSGIEVNINRSAFDNVANNTEAKFKINSELGSITFDSTAIDAISDSSATGNISMGIAKVETSNLSDEIKDIVGDRPVYDFLVKADNTEISSFNGGNVQISIPYTLEPGEGKANIVVYYISDDGTLKTMRGSYDEATGSVNFVTNHFSQYVIDYNEVNFSDVLDTDWYSEAVGFIAARSITVGTGNDEFSPNATLTRGQFIVMAMNAYGIEPDENQMDNFGDAGNTYYTDYLAAAKQLGIANGVGNNLYVPERAITRQEMFTLLYNILEAIGELREKPESEQLATFSDADQVDNWAKDAITLFVESGIIIGNNNKLYPEDTASRAEMAQVLYNLLAE